MSPRAGVDSGAELNFLANSKFRIPELELNWPNPVRAEWESNWNCQLPSFEYELDSELPSTELKCDI